MHETWDYSPIDVPYHARIGKINAGDNALQVGTGTGYTAALLCERLGSNKVITVDIDPNLSNDARTRLDHVGYTPTLVTGTALPVANSGPEDILVYLEPVGREMGLAHTAHPRLLVPTQAGWWAGAPPHGAAARSDDAPN